MGHTVLNSMVDLSMANWQCHNQMVSLKNWIVLADFDPDEVLLNLGDGNWGDGNINGHSRIRLIGGTYHI